MKKTIAIHGVEMSCDVKTGANCYYVSPIGDVSKMLMQIADSSFSILMSNAAGKIWELYAINNTEKLYQISFGTVRFDGKRFIWDVDRDELVSHMKSIYLAIDCSDEEKDSIFIDNEGPHEAYIIESENGNSQIDLDEAHVKILRLIQIYQRMYDECVVNGSNGDWTRSEEYRSKFDILWRSDLERRKNTIFKHASIGANGELISFELNDGVRKKFFDGFYKGVLEELAWEEKYIHDLLDEARKVPV